MATQSQSSATPIFIGEFCHCIDGKNRITIPSAWRSGEEVALFVFASRSGNFLKVMPRAEVDRIRAKADDLDGAQRTAFLRSFGSGGRPCTLDKNGRLSLPDEFCRTLDLKGDLTLSGSVETFEIWNTAEWNAARPTTEAAAHPMMQKFGL